LTASEVINPPPAVSIFNYPAAITVAAIVGLTALILFVSGRFDPTQGVLTLSVMITLGMLGATAYCLIFTIPVDDITPSVVGGLTAGFGAVLAYWFGRGKG
jgi:hypothetical protein